MRGKEKEVDVLKKWVFFRPVLFDQDSILKYTDFIPDELLLNIDKHLFSKPSSSAQDNESEEGRGVEK